MVSSTSVNCGRILLAILGRRDAMHDAAHAATAVARWTGILVGEVAVATLIDEADNPKSTVPMKEAHAMLRQ